MFMIKKNNLFYNGWDEINNTPTFTKENSRIFYVETVAYDLAVRHKASVIDLSNGQIKWTFEDTE